MKAVKFDDPTVYCYPRELKPQIMMLKMLSPVNNEHLKDNRDFSFQIPDTIVLNDKSGTADFHTWTDEEGNLVRSELNKIDIVNRWLGRSSSSNVVAVLKI